LRAKAPPLTLASVVRVMLVNARTFPANEVAVPSSSLKSGSM
jgi:hypothetical protein